MRALYIHISGLAGLLVFLKEVLNYAPIERTILVAATTGLTVYLMLIVGHSIVQRIMAYSPPTPPHDRNAAPSAPHNAPMPDAASAPEAAPARADAAALTAESHTDPNAPSSATDTPDRAQPDADRAPAAAESEEAAPDRAPASDRSETESSEPVTKTPA